MLNLTDLLKLFVRCVNVELNSTDHENCDNRWMASARTVSTKRINKKLRLPDEKFFYFFVYISDRIYASKFFSASHRKILKKDDEQADAAFLEAFIRHTMEKQEHVRDVYADPDTDWHDSTSRQIFWYVAGYDFFFFGFKKTKKIFW